MDKDVFAQRHGFQTFEEMLQESNTVIFDEGVKYLVTKTPKYYLAWLQDYPEYPLGRFDTFNEAHIFLIAAFKEAEEASRIDIPVRLVSAFSENQME